ncbi:MAG: hypothetical protein J7M40_05420, partial [Planctomycetes bacterium]|nr:hypothetical protein [Planctomycetota bacterium]
MTGSKNKDIVEEVFSRSMNVDDRASAFFACSEHPRQVSLEKGQKSPSNSKGSPEVKDAGSLDAEERLRIEAEAKALAEQKLSAAAETRAR